MEASPVSLERLGSSGIKIVWSDGASLSYTASGLRAACPCATCREKRGSEDARAEDTANRISKALPVLALAEARPLTIERMRPVGNYAYNIAFSDGHDSGIYTFEQLLAIGKVSN